MRIQEAGKLGFAVVVLGVSAAVAYSVLFRPTPADLRVIENICLNPKCGAEFQMEQREMDRKMKARESITCPKCGSVDTESAHRCGNCGKLNRAVGHGSAPPACAFCKKPWTFAPLRK
ncbi:MAG: hypothetical protein HZB38_02985 [Planctomycetes bacterium]|nr:hypothetical protein [Planctomycetota bacterium]